MLHFAATGEARRRNEGIHCRRGYEKSSTERGKAVEVNQNSSRDAHMKSKHGRDIVMEFEQIVQDDVNCQWSDGRSRKKVVHLSRSINRSSRDDIVDAETQSTDVPKTTDRKRLK